MADRGLAGILPNRSPDVAAVQFSDPKKGGDGSYHVNGDKDFVQWRWRVGQLNQGGVSSALPSSLAPQDVIIDFGAQDGQKGDSEVGYFWARETSGNNRFAVTPKITTPLLKYLSNVPISSNLVFGTSQLPGYLASPIYVELNSDMNFQAQALASSPPGLAIDAGAFCRAYNDSADQQAARRAAKDGCYTPMWVGPQDKQNATLTGPEISIPSGATIKLRFPAPGDADFVVAWILDDSTSTTGMEPLLNVVVQEEANRERLIDWPPGLDWRSFLACPTVTVTGMPTGGVIRAMSLKSPRGAWTHRIPAKSALEVQISSADAGTVTFRAALHGWAVACGSAGSAAAKSAAANRRAS